MKSLKTFLLCSYTFLLLNNQIFSQPYKFATGIISGSKSAASTKAYFTETKAIELQYSYNGTKNLTRCLFEFSKPTEACSNINWFYGFGANYGFYKGHYIYSNAGSEEIYVKRSQSVGVNAIMGGEYVSSIKPFGRLPLVFGVNLMLNLDIIGESPTPPLDLAVSVKYYWKDPLAF